MPNRTSKKPKQLDSPAESKLFFRLSLQKPHSLQANCPYSLIVGSEKSAHLSNTLFSSAVITIDNTRPDPLKSHFTWIERLIEKLSESPFEPKLNFLNGLKQTMLAERGQVWLTQREQQMLKLRYLGLTAKESAVHYGLSHRTVEKQLESAKSKLGIARLSPPLLSTLFNSINIVEQHLSRHPPAVAKDYSPARLG